MRRTYPLLTLGIAGCMLVGGTPVAWAAEAPPFVQAIPISAVTNPQAALSAVSITSKDVTKETDLVSVKLSIPVLSGLKDTHYQETLNSTIERNVMKQLDTLEKQAQEGADQAKEHGYPFHKYVLNVTGKLSLNGGPANADRVSLKLETYTYTGGAHGASYVSTFNFTDGTEARALTLQELFGDNYKATIDTAIEQAIQAKPENYFKDAFKGIDENQLFYMEPGQAVISFPVYEIAPGAAGTPEFRIPLPGSTPPSAASGITVTAKEVSKDSDVLKAKLSIPVLSGMKDTRYQAEVNDIIERHAMKDLTALEQQAQKDAEQAKQPGGYEFRPYELDVRYVLKSAGGAANADRISLEVQTYTYTGGANGMPRVDTYNFTDGTEAKLLTLQDLFGDSYKQTIDTAIQQAIQANPDHYFKDAFKGISDTQSFYVEKGDAVIVFGKYEIAPGAAGTPEFRIPLPGNDTGTTPPVTAPAARLTVNGQAVSLEEAPVYVNDAGAKMVPLRAITDALGYQLTWNPEKRQAELSKGAQWTVVQEGKDNYTVNKMAPIQLGTAPVIHNEKLYVPLAFFAEILKQHVTDADGAISIHTP